MRPDSESRFEVLLAEVLDEVANPAPSEEFVQHLHSALESESPMSNSATLPNSILWTGQQPASSWNLRRMLLGAVLVHALAFALIAFMTTHPVRLITAPEPLVVSLLEPPPPLKALPRTVEMGGGGGQRGGTPVTRGTPPRFAPQPLNPPKAPPLEQPKLNIPVTVNVQSDLKMATSDIPQIGVTNAPIVGMSMGSGRGVGLGSGAGNGMGPGLGGNAGGGVQRVGGGVSAPVVIFQPEAEFSEEARKAKVSGNVIVYLQVDELGHPQHVRVIRGIGLGLDEKAVEAVRRYRFKPALKNGRPVAVEMNVAVDFEIL